MTVTHHPQAVDERRKSRRVRALKKALIVFNNGHTGMGCQIVEVSDTGAKLIPDDPFSCPTKFVLKIQLPDFQFGESHHCEVRWRRGTKLGVCYLPAPVFERDEGADYDGTPVLNYETTSATVSNDTDMDLLQTMIEKSMVVNYDKPKSAAFILVSVDRVNSITAAPDDGRALLLNEIVTRLGDCIRKNDLIGVLSTDQIGIVLPYFRSNGVVVVKNNILSIASRSITTPDGQFDVTLSTTSVLFPDRDLTAAEVIKRAQATLAYSKTTKVDPLELTRPMRVQGARQAPSVRQ